MDDLTKPLTTEERIELAKGAYARIAEATADYLRATKEDGDAETLTDAIVLFEAQGIDGESGEPYTRTHYFAVSDQPKPSTILGILKIAGAKLEAVCL